MQTGPFYHVKKAVLREVSVVAVGADATTRMGLAAQFTLYGGETMEFEKWLEQHKIDATALTEEQKARLKAAFDKVAAAKKKGKRCGGMPVLGYDIVNTKFVVNPQEAKLVRYIFDGFIKIGSTTLQANELNNQGYTTKTWTTRHGKERKGHPWNKCRLYDVLNNRTYLGEVTHKGNVYPGEHQAIIPRELWDKVHVILEKNKRVRGNHTRCRTPALLKGLIRCGHCQTGMGISFCRTDQRLYRYYSCLNVSKGGYTKCPVKSVAAGDIEQLVTDRLRDVLRDPEVAARIARAPGIEPPLKADEIRQTLHNVDALWAELFPAEQTRIIQLLVKEVVVDEKQVVLTLRTNGLRSLVLESKGVTETAGTEAGEQDTVTITIPAQFRRRGGRKEIIVPADGGPLEEPAAPPQEPLVVALAQAHHWQGLLDEGKFSTSNALARRLRVSPAYVTRMLRLNYLAPDIVQAILQGREPSGLSLVKLTQPLPAEWAEQRAYLGFTG